MVVYYQNEVYAVDVSYNKLFKLLIDKRIKKGELCESANISPSTFAKLAKGENVNTIILVRICKALQCDFSDIMEMLPNEKYYDSD